MESQRNQDHSSHYNEVQGQHQLHVSGNFFDGCSSHDHSGDHLHLHHDHSGDHLHLHLQTSCNNGGLHDSRYNHQFPANEIILNPQAGGPFGLSLTKSPSLVKELEFILNKEKQPEEHQEQFAHDQSAVKKLKATNIPAVFLKIGSWKWVSKNEGDLVAKFYYGRKKVIWEFLYGSLKKKIEIQWSHISAINSFVGEDKKGVLEIDLSEQPEYGQEVRFQAGKHTLWEPSGDFTQGQSSVCRRHTVVFLPGLLDEAFMKLLQCDSRLFNVSRQPFPTHNSTLFCNQILDFSNNRSFVHGSSSVPAVSNYGHQGTFLPPAQNTVQKQIVDGICEESPNGQVQEISFPPIGDQQDHLDIPNHGGESTSMILDQELDLHLTDIQNLAEFTNNLSWIPDPQQEQHLTDILNPSDPFSNEQNFFEVEPTCNPFKQNHRINSNGIINGFTFDDADQSHVNSEHSFKEHNSWKHMGTRIHDSDSVGGVTNHMAYVDDGSGFNNRFAFMEPSSLLPSQFNIQDFNNSGNGMNEMGYTDNRNLPSFDP